MHRVAEKYHQDRDEQDPAPDTGKSRDHADEKPDEDVDRQ